MHYYFIISLSRKAVLYLVSDPIRSRESEETKRLEVLIMITYLYPDNKF